MFLQVAFDLFVVHVDEGCAAGWDLARSQHHVREVYHSIEDHIRPEQFISLGLEDVFLTGQHDEDRTAARQRLNKLIMVKHISIFSITHNFLEDQISEFYLYFHSIWSVSCKFPLAPALLSVYMDYHDDPVLDKTKPHCVL